MKQRANDHDVLILEEELVEGTLPELLRRMSTFERDSTNEYLNEIEQTCRDILLDAGFEPNPRSLAVNEPRRKTRLIAYLESTDPLGLPTFAAQCLELVGRLRGDSANIHSAVLLGEKWTLLRLKLGDHPANIAHGRTFRLQQMRAGQARGAQTSRQRTKHRQWQAWVDELVAQGVRFETRTHAAEVIRDHYKIKEQVDTIKRRISL